jgi:TRAP-type C4-dicarboxylate transport system permease small subunit
MEWLKKNFEALIASMGFVLMLVSVSVNVFSRYFFSKSFSSSEELAFMGFTYCVFFGASMLYRKNALIAIDIIVDRLKGRARKVVRILNFAILTVVNIYLVYLSINLSVVAWVRPTAALRIPYTFIDISAVVAFTLMSIYSIRFLIDAIKGKEEVEVALEDRK